MEETLRNTAKQPTEIDVIILAVDINWQTPAVFARNKISLVFNLDMIEKGYRSWYLVQTNCVALHL
jgi:hypothetical protein